MLRQTMNMLNFKSNKKIIQKNVYANPKRSCSDSKSETQDLRQRNEIITNFKEESNINQPM